MASSRDIAKYRAPVDDELERETRKLDDLTGQLAERELSYLTAKTDLDAFERRVQRIFAPMYAKLAALEAELAELLARHQSDDAEAASRAEEARAQSDLFDDEAARWTGRGGAAHDGEKSEPFAPDEDLKSLFRRVAKAVHPDGAATKEELVLRTRLMAEANAAYQAQDRERLEGILLEWEGRPEAVKGGGAEAELERVRRRIDQVRKRLLDLDQLWSCLKLSDAASLRSRFEASGLPEGEQLRRLVAAIEERIASVRQRIEELRPHAQEGHG